MKKHLLKSIILVMLAVMMLVASMPTAFAASGSYSISKTSIELVTGAQQYIKILNPEGLKVANSRVAWSTTNKSVATVTSDGLVTAVNKGTATIKGYYVGTNKTFSCSVTVKNATLSKTALTLTTGAGETLTLKHPNGKNILSSSIKWKSSNTSVAKVSAKGGVTAVAAGTANITATYKGKAYTCKVTVKDPTFNYSSYTLIKGEKLHLKLKNAEGKFILDSSIKWKSSNTAVATVSAGGYVKAVAKGSATITATYKGKNYTSKITVATATINNANFKLGKGNTYQLKLKRPNGNTINASKITWKSSNTSIATVSSTGAVKGLKHGDVTITATYKGVKYTSKITVTYAPETGTTRTLTYYLKDTKTGYDSTDESYTFIAKTTTTYKITVINTELDSEPYSYFCFEGETRTGETVTYTKDPNDYTDYFQRVYYENDPCTFTYTVPAGKYRLYVATYGNTTVIIEETKKPGIVGPAKKLSRGYSYKFTVEGVKNGGTWSSSNTSIATVSSTGKVKTKKNGSCYIYYTLYNGKKLSYKINVVSPVSFEVSNVADTRTFNECNIYMTNNTPKTIDYVEFNIKQYNYRGSRVYGPYSYYYSNKTVSPYKKEYLGEYWVHDNAETCKVSIKYIRFTDGTTWIP